MKIYIPDFKPNNIHNAINLDNLDKKVFEYQDIYSEEGIFKIQNNIVSQLIPTDIPIEKLEYNNITFILDKSKYIFRKDIYCIPYNHIVYNIKRYEYKLNSKSKIILNIIMKIEKEKEKEKEKNKIIFLYFHTNEEKLYKNFKDDIIEYISLFNNIKQS